MHRHPFANICHWAFRETRDGCFPSTALRSLLNGKFMLKLRNIEPMTVAAVELAYRYARGVPELDLKEWLETLPDVGSRLHAIDRLLSNDHLDKTCSAREQQQALLVARAGLAHDHVAVSRPREVDRRDGRRIDARVARDG
jgi:hypothetical protein